VLEQWFQPSEHVVTNIADPQAREFFEGIALIAKNNALVASMQQNISKTQILNLAHVALEVGRWRMSSFVLKQHFGVDE
jgi:hypothetical protein